MKVLTLKVLMSQLSNLKFPQIIITVVRKKYGFKFFFVKYNKSYPKIYLQFNNLNIFVASQ